MENPTSNAQHEVRKIIDHAQLHQITEKLFCRLPVHLIHNNQRHAIQAMNYQHPQFEVLHQLPRGDSRTLLLEKDDHSMMLECSVVNRTEKGTEIVKPMRLYLTKRGIRHENRVAVAGGELAGQVRNVIPQTEFYRVNAGASSGRDALLMQYANAMKELVPECVVKFELQRANRLTVQLTMADVGV